jgi:hypothetical protein
MLHLWVFLNLTGQCPELAYWKNRTMYREEVPLSGKMNFGNQIVISFLKTFLHVKTRYKIKIKTRFLREISQSCLN